ncbi:lactonase family protein [Actinophytocola xanthii]|uniref:6-phosphogluconolactonase n=1 Tax=Actinophytocola xanthii TaxID=1912961 RepID=A0A1Q8CQP3_9PSEU|nr:beta-propeller fold lactonase family protein [Actinophytocola xanthii]OLF16675.1 6-phosphogluconolactonase [Actinophytocola xanthii]
MFYVGCYTSASDGNGTGITALRADPSGDLTVVAEVAMASPSWLARHPTAPVLYAANESADGGITTVSLDTFEVVDRVSSGGADPCHLAVTPDERFLLCANYSSGSLAVFGLDAAGSVTGRTELVEHSGSGPVADRQEAAHVHMAVSVETPAGTLVSAVDLGTDEIHTYLLSGAGTLEPVAVSAMPPGTGPRQLVRRPGTDLAYVPGELSGTVVTVREGPAGTFTPIDVTGATARPYPDGPNHVAHAQIVGERLYVSNRGPDRVTEFDLSGATPAALVDHPSGAFPRHFTITDGVCHVAAQRDDAIVSFPLTGGEPRRFRTGTPTCVIVG